jgi:hypothetical protein
MMSMGIKLHIEERAHLLQCGNWNALHTKSLAVELLRFIERVRGYRKVYVGDTGQHGGRRSGPMKMHESVSRGSG